MSNFQLLIYLLYCAVNDIVPDASKTESADPDGFYQLARFHSVAAPAAIALDKAGVRYEKFDMHLKKALRNLFLFEHERSEIFRRLEENGIRYCPLKGLILKDIYGEPGLREMADNDILFDPSKEQVVREIMLGLGYTEEVVEDSNGTHDSYLKPPSLNFEMHKKLFGRYDEACLREYYDKNTDRLLINDGGSLVMRFSDEDFYVFLTAHEYKHYRYQGTGIRSLLDRYVFLLNKESVLDREYIDEQLRELNIAGFEKISRGLAFKLFSDENVPRLDDDEKNLLLFCLRSGTFGTYGTLVENRMDRANNGGFTKSGYIKKRLFPSPEYLAESVPFVRKSRLLYPVGYVWRMIRTLLSEKDRLSEEIKTIKYYDPDKR